MSRETVGTLFLCLMVTGLVVLAIWWAAAIDTKAIRAKSVVTIHNDGELAGKAGIDHCPCWELRDREVWLEGYIEGEKWRKQSDKQ